MTIKSVTRKCVSRKQKTIWIRSAGYCLRVNWNKQIYGAQQCKEQAIAGANMPGACLTSIKIKSLIALIISVPLHFKQPLALPKRFNCVLAELWACWEKTSGRAIKGRKKAEVQTCISKRNCPNEYPEVKTGTITSLWVCTSNKYLSPSAFDSCEWNFEMLVCWNFEMSGLKGSKPHLRNHEVSKWALREEQGWLQHWILAFSPAACPSFLPPVTTEAKSHSSGQICACTWEPHPCCSAVLSTPPLLP